MAALVANVVYLVAAENLITWGQCCAYVAQYCVVEKEEAGYEKVQ